MPPAKLRLFNPPYQRKENVLNTTTPDYSLTSGEFLAALAKGLPDGLGLLYSWKGGKGFPARRWEPESVLPQERDTYVCVGASRGSRRRREDMALVRAFVVDDVGTKSKAPSLPPSWITETSPGNFQWGYLLDWSDELDLHDALNHALVAAGGQDKGAQGVNRLVRVPGSLNTKPEAKGWRALVREWHPERVWSGVKALAKALGVKLGAVMKKLRAPINAGTKGAPDSVFDWLQARGMVRAVKTDGWYEITCPFAHEHLNDPRDDAAYKPLGADDSGTRGFKCFHSHGEEPGFYRRFLEWVAAEGGMNLDPDSARTLALLAKVTLGASSAPALAPYDHHTLFEALGTVAKSVLPQLDMGKTGVLKVQPTTAVNVMAVLRTLGVGLRYNLMTHTLDYTLPERVDPQRLRAAATMPGGDARMLLQVMQDICSGAGLRHSASYRSIIDALAVSEVYHPMDEWIRSRAWDGRDHFTMLLASVKTPSPYLFRTYLWRWLVQGIEAACGWRRTNQKAGVLVLVGPQGIGKTRWLTSLAPQFSVEGMQLHLSGFGARDTMHEALSRTLVELGELEITFGKSEAGALKNFLSKESDKYRLPYAESWVERPRCTSFCGSVNDPGFLVDATGSRRFWPVMVERCFYDHGIDTQQLWAQVHAHWLAGEKWWLNDDEENLRLANAERYTQPDSVTETLETGVRERTVEDGYDIRCGLTITQVHTLLKLPTDRKSLSVGSAALDKALHKRRDLRNFGGSNRAWIFSVSSPERSAFKLKPLDPKAFSA